MSEDQFMRRLEFVILTMYVIVAAFVALGFIALIVGLAKLVLCV